MIGQTLHTRYTVTARLGKGAMGTVYRTTDAEPFMEGAIGLTVCNFGETPLRAQWDNFKIWDILDLP